MITKAELIALAIRNGIPAAVGLVNTLRIKVDEVTDEQWQELVEFSKLTAEDFKSGHVD